MTTYKTCACGRSFTREEWQSLPFVGVASHEYPIDDEHPREEREMHETRNCPCGSTLVTSLGTSGEIFDLVLAGLNRAKDLERALGEVQKRCTELTEENRLLRKIYINETYGKGGSTVREYDQRSAYPKELHHTPVGVAAWHSALEREQVVREILGADRAESTDDAARRVMASMASISTPPFSPSTPLGDDARRARQIRQDLREMTPEARATLLREMRGEKNALAARCHKHGHVPQSYADGCKACVAAQRTVEAVPGGGLIGKLLSVGGWTIAKTSCRCNREDDGHGWAVLFESRMLGCLGCLRDDRKPR